jgi:hypothetical protein
VLKPSFSGAPTSNSNDGFIARFDGTSGLLR